MANVEANGDKVSAEDKATIDKLAAEYSGELKALGVRMDALEKKVGNVKFTGDARIRYVHTKNGSLPNADNGRIRITATAAVNDKVSVVTRLSTDNYDMRDNKDQTLLADRYYVQYTGKKLTVAVGRQGVTLGKGTIIDAASTNVTGTSLAIPVSQYKLTVLRGRLDINTTTQDTTNLTAVQFDGIKLGKKATLGADYGEVQPTVGDKTKLYGVNFDYALANKVGLFGEYVKSDADDYNKAYTVGVKVTNIAPKLNLTATYAKWGVNTVTPKFTTLKDQIGTNIGTDNTKVSRVRLDYALLANTNLYVDWSQAKAANIGASDTVNFNRVDTGLEFKF